VRIVNWGRLSGWGFLALFVAATTVVALRWSVDASMTALLPPTSRQLSEDAQRILDSKVTRGMVLSIGEVSGREAVEARRLARALAAALSSHPGVGWIETGPAKHFDRAVYEMYFARRFLLMADDPAELAGVIESVPARVADLERQLAGPAGPLVRPLAPEDPLSLFSTRLLALQDHHSRVRVEDDQFMSEDGHALLFLGLRDSALDGVAQKRLLGAIERGFANVAPPGWVLERSGVNVFAVDTETRVRADVSRIGIASSIGVLLVFLLVFRTVFSLPLAALPLVFGFMVAAAGSLLIFGRLHALTLTFGASLLGAGVDYAVHLLNHRESTLTGKPSKGVTSSIALGAVTTIVGFATLAFSGSQVMTEIAVFSSLGLAGAAASTLVVLPPLARRFRVEPRRFVAEFVARVSNQAIARPRWMIALGALLLLVSGAGLARAHWETSLEGLAPRSAELSREDERVRARVGAPNPAAFVMARGATEEEALIVNDRVAVELERAQREGLVSRYHSLHEILWSTELQRKNYEAARDPRFAAAVRTALSPRFEPSAFDPFFASLQELQFSPLTLDELRRSPLSRLVERFVLSQPSGSSILSYPEPTSAAAATELARRLAALPNVHWVEQRQLLDEAYVRLRERVRWALLFGAGAVFFIIAFQFRSLRRALATAVPALVAPTTALGLLALLGVSLNLFHLFAALVVLSMSIDYGIFGSQTLVDADPAIREATILSLVVAATTTCLSFGLLGFSSIPVLAGIGQTVSIGVATAILMVPVTLFVQGAGPPTSPKKDGSKHEATDSYDTELHSIEPPQSGVRPVSDRRGGSLKRQRWDVAWLFLPLCVSACGSPPPPAPPTSSRPPLADVLPPPMSVPFDFTWRQQLVATYSDQSFTFQAVVEKTGNELQLLFLAPYGSRALLLRQTGAEVESEYFVSQRLPFPVRYILTDVYRVYLRGFEATSKADGTHRAVADGETFVDEWTNGQLRRREVFAAQTSTEPSVTIEYRPGGTQRMPAAHVFLDNRAYGYRIEIDTQRVK
jgi:predicted exporter